MLKHIDLNLYTVILYLALPLLVGCLHQKASRTERSLSGVNDNDSQPMVVASASSNTGGLANAIASNNFMDKNLVKVFKPHEEFQVVTGILDPLSYEKDPQERNQQQSRQQVGRSASAVATSYVDGGSDDYDHANDDDLINYGKMSDSQETNQSNSIFSAPLEWFKNVFKPKEHGGNNTGSEERKKLRESIDKSKLSFELYSNKGAYKCIIKGVPDQVKLDQFCPQFEAKGDVAFITHGMTEIHYTPESLLDEKDNLGNSFDSAIFLDWSIKSDITRYISALHNRKVLGQLLGDLMYLLHKSKQLDINRAHLMGYSMGAHIMAFAARQIKKILDKERPDEDPKLHRVGLLTGFDAASPLVSRSMFLRKDDALVVQGIHSSYHFGVTRAYGHLDYFPNGGYSQPGCPGKKFFPFPSPDNFASSEVCDHNYSMPLFVESFKQENYLCQFVGYPCQDYESFLDGECPKCAYVANTSSDCHRLAHKPIIPKEGSENISQKMFFLSGLAPRMCAPNYHIRLSVEKKDSETMAQSQLDWIRKWLKRTFELKVELIYRSKRFAFFINARSRDKVLQKVVTHRFKIDNSTKEHDTNDPVRFEKIVVTSDESPNYKIETIRVSYMSHSKQEVRDKYSAIFQLSKTQDLDNPARKVYSLDKGYPL